MGKRRIRQPQRFLLFLKTEGARLSINTYDWTPEHPDFDFWTVIGQHHRLFQDSPRRSSARWLQQVLNGEDPGEWFQGGWTPILKEVAAATGPIRLPDILTTRMNDPVQTSRVGMFWAYWPELRTRGTAEAEGEIQQADRKQYGQNQ